MIHLTSLVLSHHIWHQGMSTYCYKCEKLMLVFSQSPEDDFLFVEDPSDDYFCPVTQYLLMEPCLTSCCGKHFSQEAVKKIKKAGKECPNCRSAKWTTMLNIHFQRKVKELRVFCQAIECFWQGPLSELLYHNKTCHSLKAAGKYISFKI